MFSLSSILSKSLISLDIGSSSIKVIEVVGSRRKKMSRIGLEILPPNIVQDGVIVDKDALKNKISDLLLKQRISSLGSRVGISLSGSSVVIKKVNITKSRDDPDFNEFIYHEAEQYLQYDISDLYIDWEYLPNIDSLESHGTSILLVGAKRDIVEEYISLIENIGLKVAVIDCDALASVNSMDYNYELRENFVAIVNVGHSSTQISLLVNNSFVYTREIPIGGYNYTQRIIESMGLDIQSADTLKISVSTGGRSASEECVNIFNEIHNSFVEEFRMTVDYYLQSGEAVAGVTELKKIFLTGGGSKTLGFDVAISTNMQVQVENIEPFQNILFNKRKFSPQFLQQQGHLFGVAFGLALRTIDDKKLY